MKKLALALTLVMTASLFTSCATAPKATPTPEPTQAAVATPEPTPEPSATPAGPVSSKDTLTVAQGADPKGLDPQGGNEQPGSRVMKQIYNTLVEQNEKMELVPGLAESWKFEDDDKVLVLNLRKGVKFHNGETFKASDVKFTLERASASPDVSHIVSAIDATKIEVVDDNTIKIGLKFPFAPILSHLAHTASSIVNEKAVKDGGDQYRQNPVGTGPYKFVEWKIGDSITMVRNEEYWGTPAPVKNLIMRTITENANRTIEVETGGIDIAYDIPPADIARVEGNADLKLIRSLNFSSAYIGFNAAKAPFDNPKVRQAINYALDMDSIVKAVYYGAGKPSKGPITEKVWAFNDKLEAYSYDVEKAKALLAEAGFPNGFSTTLWTNDNAQRIEIAEIAQNQLKAIGIEAKVEIIEWAKYLEDTANGKHDMYILGWVCVTGDPDYGLFATFHSSSFGAAGNRSFYKNDKVDELLDKGRTSVVPAEREASYKEAQQIIRDDAPWIFVQQGEDLNAVRKNVEGFVNNPAGHHKLFNVYFK